MRHGRRKGFKNSDAESPQDRVHENQFSILTQEDTPWIDPESSDSQWQRP